MSAASLEPLAATHRQRLEWFAARTGTTSYFPAPLTDGLLVTSRPKGIYKPEDLIYAVSIRIQLESRYPDGEVHHRDDGSWFFAYHQENPDPAMRDREYTNVALMESLNASLPVGVMRERPKTKKSSRPEYDILGLAYPVRWNAGYFYFDSIPGGLAGHDIITDTLDETAQQEVDEADAGQPLPADDYDARLRQRRQIVARRGQREFRRVLLGAYGSSCAITGCEVEDVLEAAHLRPYRGPQSQVPTNGLLLRTDIHTLLDLQLIAIDPSTRKVAISSVLEGSEYTHLAGRPLREPSTLATRPHVDALTSVWREFETAEAARQA